MCQHEERKLRLTQNFDHSGKTFSFIIGIEKILNWKLIIHILEKIDEDLLISICRTIEMM
jgi:hypothetical protein